MGLILIRMPISLAGHTVGRAGARRGRARAARDSESCARRGHLRRVFRVPAAVKEGLGGHAGGVHNKELASDAASERAKAIARKRLMASTAKESSSDEDDDSDDEIVKAAQ